MKVKSCLTLSDPMDCSLPGSSVHGRFQARVLEWVAIQDWKRSVFISVPKKGNTKECSDYHTVALISHANKLMLKILQARLQQYVNRKLQMYKRDLEKAEEPR